MPPLQVSADARTQLAILGREKFEFRCFLDDERLKAKGSPQRFVGAFEDVMHSLRKLNDSGYGVFFQVNTSDGKGNKTANITSAPCFFVDLDGAPRHNISRLGLVPHLITVTSPGKYHAYWRVEEIPLGQFKPIQQRLAKLIGSDGSVCDLPRVMRLAGFLHQKDPANPFLVAPESVSGDPPVPFDAFVAALSRAETALGIGIKPDIQAQAKLRDTHEIRRAQNAIQFLVERELINLGAYSDWFKLAAAIKHSFGEDGWSLFLQFSEAAPGYDNEVACRRQWDAIGEPSDGAPLTIATFFAQASEAGWTAAGGGAAKAEGAGKTGPSNKEDLAAFTVRLVEEAGDELWLNQEAVPHVTYIAPLPSSGTVKRHLPVHGSEYREVLQERFFDASSGFKTLKPEQASTAAAIVAMRAKKAGVRYSSNLRVGEHGGSIYVDRGTPDGAAIKINRDGWTEVFEPPIHFVRGDRGMLPSPVHGGKLSDFARHFNLSEADLQRAIGFIIGSYAVQGSFAILMTDGEQGSCKSSLNDKILGLTDPPHQPKSARMSLNPKEQDLHILAQGAHVLCFDNVSTLTADLADILCRIATGGASGARELYSNDRFRQFVVSRPVMLTCIGIPTVRADLLDRSVRITALPVKQRLTEAAVQAAFDQDRPKLLGFVFSCISAAIKNRDLVARAIESDELGLPRMADFAAFVEGAHELLGLQLGGFSALLEAGQSAMQIESATGDPVGSGLLHYFSFTSRESLSVSATELLSLLKKGDPQEQRWPASNGLSKRLKRIAVGLKHLGIEFKVAEASGHDKVQKYRISVNSSFQPLTRGEGALRDDGGGQF